MSKAVLTIAGAGVERRLPELRSHLDPRWRVARQSLIADADSVHASIAAVGMPNALNWRIDTPRLQLLQLPGTGTDGLDPGTLPTGCTVCNVYEHEGSVAEHVFSAILRQRMTWLDEASARFREGEWMYFDRVGAPCRPSICGATFGVLGFGHIGRRCAEMALLLNMMVLAHTRTVPPDPVLLPGRPAVRFVDTVEEVAKAADFFLVACPLTSKTRGLVNARALAMMPSHATIINVSRAEVIDEAALFEALAKGRIGGAILDVWYNYPRSAADRMYGSTFAFHELERVVVTPHLAANTEDMVTRRWEFIARNLNRFLDGQPVQNRVHLSPG